MTTSPLANPPGRRLILLGSTGSIGTNALEVVDHLRRRRLHDFQVVGLAGGANGEKLAEQARRHGVEHVAIAEPAYADELRRNGVRHVFAGPGAALALVEAIAGPGDLVLGAMVGAAGIPATLAAIERGCDIALANKETLVAAGQIVMPRVKQRGVHLLPIDSEHSAIFQCLLAGRSIHEVQRLVITASGGPFRTASAAQLRGATVAQALNHPTWNMGRKITIDSATMMNKALEVIEAHWLFGLPPDKIEVIIHPQSIVHSFVEFVDGSVLAQMGPPDMRTPIQYALTWPARAESCARRMDWPALRTMEFEPLDRERFPAVDLARAVIERGGSAGAIFNAVNEVAVQAFLQERIAFTQITELARTALDELHAGPVIGIDDVLKADEAARRWTAAWIERESGAVPSRKPACR